MLLSLWNYLCGYVIIEVTGFSVERFLNLSIHKGANIWDIQNKDDVVIMKASVKSFKILKLCQKKTKCKIKIINKIGFPFITFRYRKRKILAIGSLFFIFILYFMSSFIWLIEIDGYERVNSYELRQFISDNGLNIGSFKHNINKKELEHLILDNFSEISFVNLEIKGTRAYIAIVEAVEKKEIIDRDTPINIVANKDALIEDIFVSAGIPLVGSGDVVNKGDILVSGEILIGEGEEITQKEYVRSMADIRAKSYYKMNFVVENEYIIENFTGNKKTRFRFNLMGREINFLNFPVRYENYNKVVDTNQLSFGENYPLPIVIIIERYHEFIPVVNPRTEEEIKKIANNMITEKILQEFDFEIDVIDKIIEYNVLENGIEFNVLIITMQDIGEEIPIEFIEEFSFINEDSSNT